ncbi:MAG: hypothetical protein KR126chlam3_01359 [Chlamydiae bacterium]|nr:hypothetical protein [Chlamydiota bacterium]
MRLPLPRDEESSLKVAENAPENQALLTPNDLPGLSAFSTVPFIEAIPFKEAQQFDDEEKTMGGVQGLSDPNIQAMLYSCCAESFIGTQQFEEALSAANQGLNVPGTTDPNIQAKLYSCCADSFIGAQQFEEALSAANQGLNVEGITNPNIQAKLYSCCANSFIGAQQFEEALSAANQGLNVEGITNPNIQAKFYLEKAFASSFLKKWQETIDAANEGINVEGITDPNMLAILYLKKATASSLLKKWQEAIDAANEGRKVQGITDSNIRELLDMRSYESQIEYYLTQNDDQKILEVVQNGLDFFGSNISKKIQLWFYNIKMNALMNLNRLTKALETSQDCLKLLKSVPQPTTKAILFLTQAIIYKQRENFEAMLAAAIKGLAVQGCNDQNVLENLEQLKQTALMHTTSQESRKRKR